MFIDTDSEDLQLCPAAVDMETGDIYINRDVWDLYTPAEKKFIEQHEKGHYKLETNSEEEADRYALEANFGKVPGSLRSGFTAIEKAGVKDERRFNSLYEHALEIDAEHGNKIAEIELRKINRFYYKPKKQNKMRNYPGQITYIDPLMNGEPRNVNVRSKFARADGKENGSSEAYRINMPDDVAVEGSLKKTSVSGRSHKQNGISLGDYYLSFTNILLIAIAVILIAKLK